MSKVAAYLAFGLFVSLLTTVTCADAGSSSTGAVLDALVRAYPDQLIGHDDHLIFWRDGTRMEVSDQVADKSFDQLLRNASILDQFRLPYPRGSMTLPPGRNVDPGRFRNTGFFRKIYGDCMAGEVARHLTPLHWMPRSWGGILMVSRINGIADRLKQISDSLERLPQSIKGAAYPSAGTYACRAVQDTGRPSMHAYGAAIDLNIKFSDYWLWQKRTSGDDIVYRNRMPQEIVEIFEKNGFIWGGKWYHFDTMHFEYRPELLIQADSTGR